MGELLRRLKEAWDGTTHINRVVLIALVVAAAVIGGGTLFWASTPEYVTLVDNPSQSDLTGIVNFLKNNKTDYRVKSDGRSIEVPASQRSELQMSLAANGLMNSGSLGYGLLDKGGIAQSQAMEQQTIRRATEGEMENAIRSLTCISSANVKFAPGDTSPFITSQKPPTASVIVGVKAGSDLTKQNVKAIANLVARAYSGLETKNITVANGDGIQLWPTDSVDGAAGSDERRSQELATEKDIEQKIRTHVEPITGPNGLRVSVRASLDLDSISEKKREVTPGVAESKTSTTEKLVGPGAAAAANRTPGLAGNAAGGQGAQANQPLPDSVAGASGTYTGERSDTKLSTGFVETETHKAPGGIKTLQVAVVLDRSKVTPEQLTALRPQIETLAGYDATDPASRIKVTVDSIPFDSKVADETKKAAAEAQRSAEMTKYINYGVPVLIMLIMLIILARSLRTRPAPVPQTATLPGLRPTPQLAGAGAGGGTAALGGASDLGSQLDVRVTDGQDSGAIDGAATGETRVVAHNPGGSGVHEYEVIPESFDANLESIVHLSKQRPEIVASLIRNWLTDERK